MQNAYNKLSIYLPEKMVMGLLKEELPWLSVEIDGLGTARDLVTLVEDILKVV